jgi:hypothetical protein
LLSLRLSWTSQMIRKIQPMQIANHSSCHQPERPVSCRRREPTAMLGSSSARLVMVLSAPPLTPLP